MFALIVPKICFKKKSSQRMNDFRIKGILDYICSPIGGKTAMGLLFGQLLGLSPTPSPSIKPGGLIKFAIIK